MVVKIEILEPRYKSGVIYGNTNTTTK